MYSQAESSLITQKFWTSFGLYMSPVPSASLEKVNWINYKTGIKGIIFKFFVDKNAAKVAIEIFLKDTMLQHQYFDIFDNFVIEFKNEVGKDWIFHKNYSAEGKEDVSLIIVEKEKVNVFKEEDWPTIISFLKEKMLGIDKFWTTYKPAFELI